VTGTPSPFDAFDLPPPWPESLLERIAAHNSATHTRLIVLDDDPLGGQCVHDVPVLTKWEPGLLAEEWARSPAFLLLTNTRALSRTKALERAWQMGAALREAERATGLTVTPIWRSDSTLRGHYYWEMQAFEAMFRGDNVPEPAYVFLPYFGDGGRHTFNDTQYVLQDDALVPVHETEFARDPAFAYEHAHLPSWLEAHTEGRHRAEAVVSITHDNLRVHGPNRVAALLAKAPPGAAVIVNAADDRDLEVFVTSLQVAESAGKRFLCSGAASFVRVRMGQAVRPRLSATELDLYVIPDHAGELRGNGGGLTIVGSYVDKTSAQLERALLEPDVHAFEIDAPGTHAVPALPRGVSERLSSGRDAILYTSRAWTPGAGGAFAEAIDRVVGSLDVRPRYLLVKGGETASRLATGALGARRAVVLGQLLPGVPVWRLGEESRWPGLPFVIFAGNVGTEESLAEALRILREG
jgi:uncharacterized protein YgbK (DUF1537 family)